MTPINPNPQLLARATDLYMDQPTLNPTTAQLGLLLRCTAAAVTAVTSSLVEQGFLREIAGQDGAKLWVRADLE